jgi:hypothetical protein
LISLGSLSEFTTNNYQLKTTDITLCFANNGCDPHFNCNIKEQQDLSENHDTQEHATKQQEISSLIKAEMSFFQAKQLENMDRHHNLVPAYQVGELIWLNARKIITHRASVKHDNELLGPFSILALVSKCAFVMESQRRNQHA